MADRKIPIQNVYYLFLYAWDQFPVGRAIAVGEIDGPELPNLLARVLASCINTLLRRGLDRGYVCQVEETASPRGRFLLPDTIKRNCLISGRMVCLFDELTIDVLQNQILKAALRLLSRSPQVDACHRHELDALAKRLGAVSDVQLTRQLFRGLQLNRNSGYYGLALHICRMAVDLLLPNEGGQGARFSDIMVDEVRMHKVFEKFVRNFYRSEQTIYKARAEKIDWDVECEPAVRKYLPEMTTDVTLRSPAHTIVLDTKFYKETLVTRFEGGQAKINSLHLYQIQSYLRNMRGHGGPDAEADGILLYPCVGATKVRLDMRVNAHHIRVWTVDLTQEWTAIHQDLIELIRLGKVKAN